MKLTREDYRNAQTYGFLPYTYGYAEAIRRADEAFDRHQDNEKAGLTVQPRREKTVLVFASNYRMAGEWAREEKIRPADWVWVRSPEYLYGRRGNEWASVAGAGPSFVDIKICQLVPYVRLSV